jgi:hypothetical protein
MLRGMIFNDDSQCKWSCTRFNWLSRPLRCELSLRIVLCNVGLMLQNTKFTHAQISLFRRTCHFFESFVWYLVSHVTNDDNAAHTRIFCRSKLSGMTSGRDKCDRVRRPLVSNQSGRWKAHLETSIFLSFVNCLIQTDCVFLDFLHAVNKHNI